MAAQLNHTIVWCRDKRKSATFLTEILGLSQYTQSGPFFVVELENAVSLDFYEIDGKVSLQHFAFLLSEGDFEKAFERIRALELPYWADPGKERAEEIYHHNDDRGVYFDDPDGHLLEIITRAFGSERRSL